MTNSLVKETTAFVEETKELDFINLTDKYKDGCLFMSELKNLVAQLLDDDVMEAPEISLDEVLSLHQSEIYEKASLFGKLLVTHAIIEERIRELMDPVVVEIIEYEDMSEEWMRFGDHGPEGQALYLGQLKEMVANVRAERTEQSDRRSGRDVTEAGPSNGVIQKDESNEEDGSHESEELENAIDTLLHGEIDAGELQALFDALARQSDIDGSLISSNELREIRAGGGEIDSKRLSKFLVTYGCLDATFRELMSNVIVGFSEDSKSRPYTLHLGELNSDFRPELLEKFRVLLKKALWWEPRNRF